MLRRAGVLALATMPPVRQRSLALPLTPPVARRGVDLSFLPEMEAAGAIYRDHHGPRDAIALLRHAGVNVVRLRLWNNPPSGWCTLARTLPLARRVRDAGMALLLDLHYSDSWADPAHQSPPAAWAGLTFAQVRSAAAGFTRDVLEALAAQGTPPDMVQLGNEVTDGMLWPHARISTAGWSAFASVQIACAAAARDAAPAARLLLHIDRGGDNASCRWFYDNALAQGIPFDAIALSYYPWWHGTLSALAANLADLAARYARPVHIVETAYPWTLGWNDNTGNIVGLNSQLLPGFPASPAGQAAFADAVQDALAALPDRRGQMVCWWAPDWVAAPRSGSAWENCALFDFAGRVLPAADRLGGRRLWRTLPPR